MNTTSTATVQSQKHASHIINTTSIIKESKFAILNLESKAHNKNGYYPMSKHINTKSMATILSQKPHIAHHVINTSQHHHKHTNTTSYDQKKSSKDSTLHIK